MTTSWKRTEAAGGAGAIVPGGVSCRALSSRSGRVCRALRWKMDAVCRDAAADPEFAQAQADVESGTVPGAETASTGSSITRTIFFSSRIQTQPSTRKETHNTTQEKKGKQIRKQSSTRKKLETLA